MVFNNFFLTFSLNQVISPCLYVKIYSNEFLNIVSVYFYQWNILVPLANQAGNVDVTVPNVFI